MLVHLVQVRPDAERNRARIVRAARELVGTRGPDAPMVAIAGAAGVAVGTLYRHYPTKAALVAAAIEESVEVIAGLAEASAAAVLSGAAADTELVALITAVAERHVADRALKLAAAELGLPVLTDPLSGLPPGSAAARAVAAIEAVLTRARKEGRVRPDLTQSDLVMLLGAMPDGVGSAPARSRYLAIVLAGIRSTAGPS
jgi:AcrR family transcriptional regulator